MMNRIRNWARRMGRYARSLPGYLAVATTVVTVGTPLVLDVVDDLQDSLGLDLGWVNDNLSDWSARLLVVIALAGRVYKRVTEVPEMFRGDEPRRLLVTERKA